MNDNDIELWFLKLKDLFEPIQIFTCVTMIAVLVILVAILLWMFYRSE